MHCVVRDAKKFNQGSAEIYSPGRGERTAGGGAHWGGGMAEVNVQKKECACRV